LLLFKTGIPFYLQIKEDIIKKIESGIYFPGERLPSEFQLAKDYGVSRPTIRQSIAELVQERSLIRHRGKGTFVTKSIITEKIEGFKTFDQFAGLKWKKLIKKEKIEISSKTAKDLHLQVGNDLFQFTYVKGNDEYSLAIRISQISCKVAPTLLNQNLDNQSLFSVLEQKYNLAPTDVDISFQSVAATEEEANLLKIDVGEPLTMFKTILYANSEPFARVKTIFRGDQFRFVINEKSKHSFPIVTLKNSSK